MIMLESIGNNFKKILFFSVLTAVTVSFFLEFLLNFKPCTLCLYQRYLWIILLMTSGINFYINIKKNKILNSLILILLALIFSLSFYHSGIELGFFSNIISCTQNNINANTIEELGSIIREIKNNDCSFPKFYILHLSLSNLSMIFSGFLFFLSFKFLKRRIFWNNEK